MFSFSGLEDSVILQIFYPPQRAKKHPAWSWEVEQLAAAQHKPWEGDETIVAEYSIDFAAGLVAGCAGLAFGHPFDTIKVRQQLNACGQTMQMTECIRNTLRHEGVRGFFRGMAFPLGAVGILNSVFFGVYGNLLRQWYPDTGSGKSETPSYTAVFLAGGFAGAVQAIPACPIDLVKVRLQAQTGSTESTLYRGPLDCLMSMYREHGLRGCFRGITPTILREIPGFAVYITSYEYMCNKLKTPSQELPSVAVMLGAGGVAGMLSWLCNIPIDVIKSRMQSDDLADPRYRNTMDCFRKSYTADGWRVFWRGLPVISLRAFPTNAVTLAVYSYTYRAFKELHKQDEYSSSVKDNFV